jgi:hypothetical protein
MIHASSLSFSEGEGQGEEAFFQPCHISGVPQPQRAKILDDKT